MSRKEFLRLLENRLNAFCSLILDSILLIVWAAIQYYADHYLSYLNLQGTSLVIQRIIQALLGLVTLSFTAGSVYADIRIMFIRIQREIQKEKEGR